MPHTAAVMKYGRRRSRAVINVAKSPSRRRNTHYDDDEDNVDVLSSYIGIILASEQRDLQRCFLLNAECKDDWSAPLLQHRQVRDACLSSFDADFLSLRDDTAQET